MRIQINLRFKARKITMITRHTDWIRKLDFSLPIFSGECDSILLVSSSQDKGIRIWKLTLRGSLADTEGDDDLEPERKTGIWMNVITVGELSHCALGFYGGHWSPDARSILAHGFGGEFHMWKNIGVSSDNWRPQKVPSGHFASVTDIGWARRLVFLLHGTIKTLSLMGTPGMKLLGLKFTGMILIVQLSFKEKGTIVFFPEDVQADVQVLGANMSAFGLSQKPVYVNVALTEPPIEDQLAWHTLWPESHKLYGHRNELFSLCCDHEGMFVASSCKAQSATVADIWLWQVGSWKAVGRLQSHSLTVTDGILSRRQPSFGSMDEIDYNLVERREAHKRIIWTCSWNPFGHEFATGSRDKTVKIWGVEKTSSVKQLLTLPPFNSSVNALSWVGLDRQRNHGLLAVGMETGLLQIWSLHVERGDESISTGRVTAALIIRLDPFMCHVSAVNRLVWKNREKNENCTSLQLASCGADNCVRLYEIAVD
ncbi:putative ATP binding protein [Hibiscus syriacus]|uniref:Elongator complex protein 2 n=1 Tax=Hibiscus syriacus TaxID=106335 RepID=A0A6A2ZGU9_HIBSY|nr:putative ATP binding protein [Hibiscus syriacus]